MLSTRYLLSQASVDDVLAMFETSVDPIVVGTLGFTLLIHQDPEQRAPEPVLERLDELERQHSSQAWPWLLRTLALMQLEDWEGAAAALEGQYEHTDISVYPPPVFPLIRV